MWEEAFPTVRHIWRAGSGSGLPGRMHGHTGERTKKGREDGEGPEVSDIQRKAKRAEPVQCGKEKAQGDFYTVQKCLMGGIKVDFFFSGAWGQDRKQAQTEIWEILNKSKMKGCFFM